VRNDLVGDKDERERVVEDRWGERVDVKREGAGVDESIVGPLRTVTLWCGIRLWRGIRFWRGIGFWRMGRLGVVHIIQRLLVPSACRWTTHEDDSVR
jgi:hypothetical protein